MALPKINETLNFNMTIPSTGNKIKYRPYLVKDERILLQAFESKDMQMCLVAMSDTLTACIDPRENIEVDKLSTFDIEYMFTQLREKSVGETSTILISCSVDDCTEKNEYVINLDDLKVEVSKGSNVIVITPEISVEMAYPTYATMIKEGTRDTNKESPSNPVQIMAGCIAAVLTREERIEAADETIESMEEFVGNMTANQLQQMAAFLENMPALKHNAEFECTKCEKKNSVELKGLSDFF